MLVKQNDSFRIHIVSKTIYQTIHFNYKDFDIDVKYINNESEIEKIEKEAKYKFNVIDSDLFKFKLAISKKQLC